MVSCLVEDIVEKTVVGMVNNLVDLNSYRVGTQSNADARKEFYTKACQVYEDLGFFRDAAEYALKAGDHQRYFDLNVRGMIHAEKESDFQEAEKIATRLGLYQKASEYHSLSSGQRADFSGYITRRIIR